MRLTLRAKILIAILGAVLATVALAAWAVNDRIEAGAHGESATQARAQSTQAQALYQERGATLIAEAEAISLYPAVITAVSGGNAAPLLRWSGDVAALQGRKATVVDASGKVIARGHAPEQTGDDLAAKLAGLRLALAGAKAGGLEDGDEIGRALRGYAPVRKDGRTGDIVGAVMIADPLDAAFLARLAGGGVPRVEDGAAGDEGCATAAGSPTATCRFPLRSPDGTPSAVLALSVPLTDIQRASGDARRRLWLAGLLLLAVGAIAAWLLARSLTQPLARLRAAAGHIAAGAYDHPTGVRGRDEIGDLARAFDTMRARVAAATGALRRERDMLDSVLDATGDGILMTDLSGRTVVANRRWAELLGGDGLEAAAPLARAGEGTRFADAAAAWLADPALAASADFERFDPYCRFRCYSAPVALRDPAAPKGDSADQAGSRFPVPGSRCIGRIFVLRDVTRESEAERMRSALVSTVSHELRSPLTAITGYTATLLSGGPWDAEMEREFLEIVAASADKLSRLVDNLLDAAKMEAGVLHLEREPVRVERIVAQVVAHRRALLKDHELRAEIAPDLPLADADPMRVEQVITNLVENAIKYAPAGGTITVHVTGGEELTVSVNDEGVGIAPEHAEKLFERFYRVDSGLARTTKGVGLGLYICKSLVAAHGGQIWVTSAPGAGSTFSFTLPVLDSAEGRGMTIEDGARLSLPSVRSPQLEAVS